MEFNYHTNSINSRRPSYLWLFALTRCLLVTLFISLGWFVNLAAQDANDALRLNDDAAMLFNKGKYQEARRLAERALAIWEKTRGPDHLDTALGLSNLSNICSLSGDYPRALILQQRALSIRERLLGPLHCDTAISIHSLANIYFRMGDYSNAKTTIERAVVAWNKMSPPQERYAALSLNTMGVTLHYLGDHDQAINIHRRALSIRERLLGAQHPETAESLHNLSGVYSAKGESAVALLMAKRALEIRERALGPQHPDTEATRLSVASIGSPMGEDRLVVLEDALVRLEKSFGADHPETAAGLNNLASYYSSLGNDAKALPLHERALAICENVLGPQHPNTAATLNFLAKVQYKSGDIATARSYASRQVAAKHRELESILALDEATRLAWQAKNLSFWHACVLRPEPLGQVVLRLKGVVLDSLLEDRSLALSAKDDPNSEAILKEIAELRGQLSAIAFDTGNQDAAEVLEQRIAQLQRSLATRATAAGRVRASADITFDAIFPALGQYAAFVDFIRFEDPKLKGDDATCYGAVITGSDGSPLFVRIDGGAAIDNAIDTLRSAINQRQDQEVEAQTKFLSEKLWQPIAAKIPEGTKQVIICPDAKLNFLAFGSLLESDGRFVAEKFPIAYMGSGRDLTRKPSIEAAKSLVVFADPVFDASGKVSSAKEMVAMRSAEADVFGAINLPPLPGTKAEAEQLEVIAAGAGWDIKTTTGDEATESSVREAKKPGVLHLATHGFYLNSFSPPAENGTRGMSVVGFNNEEDKKQNENGVDPMRASGVALTGAQQTLKLWSQRKAPDPKTDGILTAEEVASLDLNGTWLVTLSACETGVGEARSGEGVFGLRRAFMMAGAENLLMTLWPVSDDTTASIMADFYTEALATGDAPGSLAKVQRDWLVKLREEKGLATAIREAGPFAMVMMTAPTHPPVELPPVANLEAKDTSTPATTTQPAGEASSE